MKDPHKERPEDWPDLPVAFPFTVKQSFRPRTQSASLPKFKVSVGDEGIVRKKPDKGFVCVEILRDAKGNKGAIGWAPIDHVEIGQRYPANDPAYLDVAEPQTADPGEMHSDQADCLTKAINGLLGVFYTNRKDIRFVTRYIQLLLNSNQKVRDMTSRIILGIRKVKNGESLKDPSDHRLQYLGRL